MTYSTRATRSDVVRGPGLVAWVTHEDGCNYVIACDTAIVANALIWVTTTTKGVVKNLAALTQMSSVSRGQGTGTVQVYCLPESIRQALIVYLDMTPRTS